MIFHKLAFSTKAPHPQADVMFHDYTKKKKKRLRCLKQPTQIKNWNWKKLWLKIKAPNLVQIGCFLRKMHSNLYLWWFFFKDNFLSNWPNSTPRLPNNFIFFLLYGKTNWTYLLGKRKLSNNVVFFFLFFTFQIDSDTITLNRGGLFRPILDTFGLKKKAEKQILLQLSSMSLLPHF